MIKCHFPQYSELHIHIAYYPKEGWLLTYLLAIRFSNHNDKHQDTVEVWVCCVCSKETCQDVNGREFLPRSVSQEEDACFGENCLNVIRN